MVPPSNVYMRAMVLEIECFRRRDVFFFLEVSPSSGRVLLFLTRPRPNVFYNTRVPYVRKQHPNVHYIIYLLWREEDALVDDGNKKGNDKKKKITDHAMGQYNTAYTFMHIAYILSYTLIPIYKCMISGVPKIH